MRKMFCKIATFSMALGLMLSANINAAAAEDITTIYITEDPGTIEERELTSCRVDSEDGQYTVIVNGVTDHNKEEYTEKILEAIPNLSKDAPVKFVNNMFVDSEKYIYTKEGYDAYHCWLASTANMLVISGWNEGFENPILQEGTKSYEDEILLFFTSSFSDKGSLPENGISYFLNGIYGVRTRTNSAELLAEETDLQPGDATKYTGVNADYCSQQIVNRVDVDYEENNYLEIAETFEKLPDFAISASMSLCDMDTKQGVGMSHNITITGVVMDNTKTGLDKYVAVIIADSDNEPCAEDMPTSMDEALKDKKEKVNSYTMYSLGEFENAEGRKVWGLYGYHENTFLEFNNVTSLGFKNETNEKLALETSPYATKDSHTAADIIPTLFYTHDDEYNLAGKYELGSNIYAMYQIFNRSDYVDLNQESAGKDTFQSTVYVYRNGELVGEITDGFEVNLTAETIEIGGVKDADINLTDSGLFKETGIYTLKFVPNTNEVKEMYLINNIPMEETFEIVDSLEEIATDSDIIELEEDLVDLEIATTTDVETKAKKKTNYGVVYGIVGVGVLGLVVIGVVVIKKRRRNQ